jgi:selenocysteine lyase/cysteine desulfurase
LGEQFADASRTMGPGCECAVARPPFWQYSAIEAIGARARDVGAAYVLDGIQLVGALPFDLQRVRPDLLVCSSYKWLLGPMGIGLCYIGERFTDGEPLEETARPARQ